jgi:glyoxylase-like metal-dependent hydrolase (beta-lactamase superfamily II)
MIAIGGIRVHVLRVGSFALDGGALFGVVPRVLWERSETPDARNRVRLAVNVVLVETGEERVLIDTGLGDKLSEKLREIYGIDEPSSLLAELAGVGVQPEAVDVVVNSHLHFDHAGGNTRVVDGRTLPTFPKARYVAQLGEWEDATHPHELSRASYLEENCVPIAEAHQLDLVQGEAEVAPGVRVVLVGGHTAYHQIVMIEDGGETLVVPTDILPTTAHVSLAWVTGLDLFPVGTLQAKKRLLEGAAEGGWSVVFGHDTRTRVAKIVKRKDRYVLGEVRA